MREWMVSNRHLRVYMETRDWTVRHERVPNVANPGIGGGGDEDEDDKEQGEYKQGQHEKGDRDDEVEKRRGSDALGSDGNPLPRSCKGA